jgi:hypothetical protein
MLNSPIIKFLKNRHTVLTMQYEWDASYTTSCPNPHNGVNRPCSRWIDTIGYASTKKKVICDQRTKKTSSVHVDIKKTNRLTDNRESMSQ